MRKAKWLFIIVFLFVGVFQAKQVFAEDTGLDVIFVIDDSASMQENDKQFMAGEALKSFVDILPQEGDKVGAVTFDGDIRDVQELMLTTGKDSKDKLKNFTSKITQKGVCTNIPNGLQKATQMLKGANDKNKKIIIFVTDGQNDLPGNGSPEEDNAKVAGVLKDVESEGIPIYGIGIGDSDKKYIENISKSTDGKAFFPSDNKQLIDIFRAIASETASVAVDATDAVKINNSEFTTINRDIPEGIFEVNIQVNHDDTVITEIVDSKGQNISTDSNKVIITNTKYYTNAKILHPEAGKYQIKLKSKNGNQDVKVNWIFSYDIEIKLSQSDDKKNFVVNLYSRENILKEPESYKNLIGNIEIKNLKSNEVKTEILNVDGASLIAPVELEKNIEYEATAKVSSNKFKKVSNTLQFSVQEKKTEKKVKKKNSKSIPLIIGILLLGLGIVAAIFYFIKNKKNAKLQGKFQIEVLNASELIETRTVQVNFSSKTLSNLLNSAKFSNSATLDAMKSMSNELKKGKILAISGNEYRLSDVSSQILPYVGSSKYIVNDTFELSKDNVIIFKVTFRM